MENNQNHGDVKRWEKTKIRTNQNDINGGHSSHSQHKVIAQIKPYTKTITIQAQPYTRQ